MPDSLQAKLAAARNRWRSIKAIGGVAACVAILSALALASFYTDRLIVLTTAGRWVWLIALLAGTAIAAFAFVIFPLCCGIADEDVAEQVERQFPALNERLLTTIELAHAGAGAGASTAMISQLARETERLSSSLNFTQAMPLSAARRPTTFAAFGVLLLAGHFGLAPDAMSVWMRRIFHPGADIPIYARTKVWVSPEDTVIPRGEDVTLRVRTGGRLPDSANLRYRYDGGRWSTARLAKAEPTTRADAGFRTFSFKMNDVQQNVTFFATANDGQANPHTIRVEDRPTILNVKLRLDYPAYTHKRPEIVTATAGNVVAPVGTRVAVEATANKPLREATLVEDGKPQGPWAVAGAEARGALVVRKDENYGLQLRDQHGFAAQNPPQYTVRAQPDQTPTVQIVKPGADLERSPNSFVNLSVTATDDYGVEEMRLAYRIGKRAGSLPLPGADGRTQAVVGGKWNLSALNLKPGDTITYEALARDGDNVSGPHTGHSATYRISIISAGELRDRIDSQIAQEQEALKQLIQRQKEAQTQLEQARRTNKPEQIAGAETAQRSVAQDSADLAKRMQQTTEQMHDNNMSSALEQRRREATQQSLEQLAQKAMPAAADTVQRAEQQAAERNSLLSNAARQEQAIRNELERLANQSARAPEVSQLVQMAEQLAQEQQKLADQADVAAAQMGQKTPAQMTAQERARMNQLAKQQADLRARTQALQQMVQQAAQEAQEKGQANAADVQKAAQQLQRAGTAQKQSAAQKSLQSGKPTDASPQQNDAAQDLQNLANSLDNAGQKQNDAAMQQKAADLDKAADKLEEMARQQKDVARDTQWKVDEQSAKQLAQKEQSLRAQAQQMSPQLNSVPEAQQSLNRAGQNLQQSANQLNQGQPQQAASPAKEATQQLYRAAMDARAAADKMRQQQQAKQMERELQQMAREQRALEKQTEQLDGARQKGDLSPEQKKRAASLAQNQTKLKERSDSIGPDMPSPAFKWALKEAARRMEDAQRGLQQENTGEDTQRSQTNAAQTLERIARSLAQEAQGAQQSQQSGQQQSGSQQQQQMADASGELRLAREMQQQIRQETGSLDQRRSRNPGRQLTAEQQRELNNLNQAERETQRITERAARELRSTPEIGQSVQRAAEQMEDVQDMFQQQQTGRPTQGKQEEIVRTLDKALGQVRQAMRQQRQQQMAQQQQGGQQQARGQQPGQQQPGQPGGNQPAQRSFAPVVQAQPGVFAPYSTRGKGFGNLSPRAQQSLREGQQEHVSAEYRDLVNQYFKALSERGK